MEKLYLSLALSIACLIALADNVPGLHHCPNLNLTSISPITAQSDLGISSRERELLERARSQGFHISEAKLDPQDPDREVHLYTVLYQNSTDSQWHNFCQTDGNNLAKAILLSGEWDETGAYVDNREVTIACTSGVLAKCVRWGYKPWKTVEGVSLRYYHQACTRMARADYCGNGNSYTQDGTPIDLYDRLRIQKPTKDSGMVFEAGWGTDGAVFIHRTRYSGTLAQIQQECPNKLQKRLYQGNQSLTQTQIQQQTPTALIFNDSFVRKTFHNPRR